MPEKHAHWMIVMHDNAIKGMCSKYGYMPSKHDVPSVCPSCQAIMDEQDHIGEVNNMIKEEAK